MIMLEFSALLIPCECVECASLTTSSQPFLGLSSLALCTEVRISNWRLEFQHERLPAIVGCISLLGGSVDESGELNTQKWLTYAQSQS